MNQKIKQKLLYGYYKAIFSVLVQETSEKKFKDFETEVDKLKEDKRERCLSK